jgi:hypothetical protein
MDMKECYKMLFWVALVLFAVSVFAEERKIVAVVDTGYNPVFEKYLCKGYPVYDFTGTGILDRHGHGTNVAGLILKGLNPVKHCLVFIKLWDPSGIDIKLQYIDQLLKLNPSYANLSFEGSGYSIKEFIILGVLTSQNTKVVVAAGNSSKNLSKDCDTFPACYPLKKNYYVVGATDSYSNYGTPVRYKEVGTDQCANNICLTGTSQAAANFTADLLRRD